MVFRGIWDPIWDSYGIFIENTTPQGGNMQITPIVSKIVFPPNARPAATAGPPGPRGGHSPLAAPGSGASSVPSAGVGWSSWFGSAKARRSVSASLSLIHI